MQGSLGERNDMLKKALAKLAPRFPGSAWVQAAEPLGALHSECVELINSPDFLVQLRVYLRGKTVVKRAIESFYTAVSMASRARWQEAAPEHRGVVARG